MNPFPWPTRPSKPVDIRKLPVPSGLSLLFLGPHPDDFDAVAVTMRWFHQRGTRLHVAVATPSGSGVEDGYSGARTPEAKATIREKEQRESCRFFGLPESALSFLHMSEDEDGHPTSNDANLETIRHLLAETQPDILAMPHGNDTNPGHQRIYTMAMDIPGL